MLLQVLERLPAREVLRCYVIACFASESNLGHSPPAFSSGQACSFERETLMRKTLAACSVGASAAILIIGLMIA